MLITVLRRYDRRKTYEIHSRHEQGGKRGAREDARRFPAFDKSIFNNGVKLRNATITTIAPTGTLSIIADCSSGIEPVFAYSYIKRVLDKEELIYTNEILKEELTKRGLLTDALINKIAEKGSLSNIKEIPDDIKKVFVSAHDITPEDHIRMQAAFQKYTDNAVSKTVNFKADATRADVDRVPYARCKIRA